MWKSILWQLKASVLYGRLQSSLQQAKHGKYRDLDNTTGDLDEEQRSKSEHASVTAGGKLFEVNYILCIE